MVIMVLFQQLSIFVLDGDHKQKSRKNRRIRARDIHYSTFKGQSVS